MEQGDYLVRYLRGKGVPEQRKSRHEYLSHYGLDQAYVYVLVSGVVKASTSTSSTYKAQVRCPCFATR